MKSLIVVIFLSFSFWASAATDQCDAFEQAQNFSATAQQSLIKQCKLMRSFCQYFNESRQCGDGAGSSDNKYLTGAWSERYLQWNKRIDQSAQFIVNETLPLMLMDLKASQDGYYSRMKDLDQLSRHSDPAVVNTVAQISRSVLSRWNDMFGDVLYRDVVYRRLKKEKEVAIATGPVAGFLASSYLINSSELGAKDTGKLFRYLRFKMPVRLFSMALPYIGIKATESYLKLERPTGFSKILANPAHLVRFSYNERTLADEFSDNNVINDLYKYQSEHEMLKEAAWVAAMLGTSSAEGNLLLSASTVGKKATKVVKLLRVTPLSFAVALAVDFGLNIAVEKYEKWDLYRDIEESLQTLVDEPLLPENSQKLNINANSLRDKDVIQNTRDAFNLVSLAKVASDYFRESRVDKRGKVIFALNTYEVFRLSEAMPKYQSLKMLIEAFVTATESQSSLDNALIAMMELDKTSLAVTSFDSVKRAYCTDAYMGVSVRSKNIAKVTYGKLDKILIELEKQFDLVASELEQLATQWPQDRLLHDPLVAQSIQSRPQLLRAELEDMEFLRSKLADLKSSRVLESIYETSILPAIKTRNLPWSCQGFVEPIKAVSH